MAAMSDGADELLLLREEVRLLRYRFNLLVEHSSEAIYLKDLDSRYVYINEAGASMMYRRPDDLIGQDDEGLFAPDVAREIRADDQHVISTGQTAVIRTMRAMTNGTRIDFLTVKRPWFDGDGTIVGVVGTTQDVTELADAQREAAEAAEGFRTLVETMAELVIVHRAGAILYANPAALGALGRRESDLTGGMLSHLARAKDRSVVAGLGAGAASRAEVGFLRPDGAVVLVELSDVPASWCGEPARVAIGRDVTVRRRMDAQLQDADRLAAVGMLAGGIAHEIRNPLTFVLGVVRELAASTGDEASKARLLDVVDAAERIEAIVQGVSGLARPDTDAGGPVDVEGVIDRALLLAGSRLRDRAVVERSARGNATVIGSERRLVQVVINLLVNASQAIGSGHTMGKVSIQTAIVGTSVRIRVRDSGPGVPMAVATRIFEPFVTTKPSADGTGLGLWVSRGIVAEMGGSLELENPGAPGASFLIALPVATAPQVELRPLAVRPRLLLVDDERLISDLLSDGLSGTFDVQACDGVAAALAKVQAEPPFDIVLCDLIMPNGGGERLFQELGTLGVRPPMCFMSGGAATPEARQFLERERILPIDKPFRIGDVRRRLLIALGARTNASE